MIKILGGVFEKNILIEELITNSALTFVKLVEGKDPETANHIERMALYSKLIAESLAKDKNYSNEIDYYFIEELYKYAPLHDIGKVGIPDSILLKPGKLSEEEFEIMKTHSTIGSKVINYFRKDMLKYDPNIFKIAAQLTVSHHESWDGTGYPLGLKGNEIPLAARIISIADVFDALTSKRPYKKAFPFNKSVEMIKELSGKKFDPDIVNAFLDVIDDIHEVYLELREV